MCVKSENSKTSELLRLLLNILDKMDLRTSNKYIALSNCSINYTWKKFI